MIAVPCLCRAVACAGALGAMSAGPQWAHTVARSPATTDSLTLALDEDLRIGSERDAALRFASVGAVRVRDDGTIVALTLTREGWTLRVHDRDGKARWSRSFPAAEPPRSLALHGDTIAVITGSGQSAHALFLQIGREKPLSSVAVPTEPVRDVSMLGAVDGKWLYVDAPNAIGGGFAGDIPLTYNVRRIDLRTGTSSAAMVWSDSTSRPVVPHPRAGVSWTIALSPPWLSRPSLSATSTRVLASPGMSYDIGLFRVDGSLDRHVSRGTRSRPVSAELRKAWIAGWVSSLAGKLYSDSVRRTVAAFPAPDAVPAVRALLAAYDGSVAVVRGDLDADPVAGGDSVRVDIFRSDGTFRGTATLPPGVSVRAIDGDHIVAAVTDPRQSAGPIEGRAQPLVQIVRYRLR